MSEAIQIAHAVEATSHTAAQSHAGSTSYLMPSEPPNASTFINALVNPKYVIAHGERPEPSEAIHIGRFEFPINPLFSMFYALVIVIVVRKALRRASIHHPGRLQMFVETSLGGLHNFFFNAIGEDGRRFIPFLGSLFLFIWINNVAALVPGMKSPTSSLKTTGALAICAIVYARYHNIRTTGFKGYVYHLLGSPTDTVTWCMSPLFLMLELIGEVIKPLSLALRLFGNIFGEDKLLATFLGLGMMIMSVALKTPTPIIGVPLHLPFYFLVLLLSTIQAVVFSLLAGIYLMLMMPHAEHHEKHPADP